MAFVNELVSEEDIRNYRLDELLAGFHEFTWRNGRPSGFIHAWTIDRDISSFLIRVKGIHQDGPSGRPEPTTQEVFVYVANGVRVLITLDHSGGSSSFSEVPFVVVRRLVDIDIPANVPQEAIINTLKDALTTYGYGGALRQVPNTIVKLQDR